MRNVHLSWWLGQVQETSDSSNWAEEGFKIETLSQTGSLTTGHWNMTWATIPMLLIKLMSFGKWGIRTQVSFTNRFPFCSLVLFRRALTGGIQNVIIPVLPWQVDTTSLSPGKVIMPTPSATTWMDFPGGKQAKGRGQQHPCPSIPLFFSKGHNSCWASHCGCRWVTAVRGAPDGFLISRDWEGVWVSIFTTLKWQLSSGRNGKLRCSAQDAAREFRFWQLGN